MGKNKIVRVEALRAGEHNGDTKRKGDVFDMEILTAKGPPSWVKAVKRPKDPNKGHAKP